MSDRNSFQRWHGAALKELIDALKYLGYDLAWYLLMLNKVIPLAVWHTLVVLYGWKNMREIRVGNLNCWLHFTRMSSALMFQPHTATHITGLYKGITVYKIHNTLRLFETTISILIVSIPKPLVAFYSTKIIFLFSW